MKIKAALFIHNGQVPEKQKMNTGKASHLIDNSSHLIDCYFMQQGRNVLSYHSIVSRQITSL